MVNVDEKIEAENRRLSLSCVKAVPSRTATDRRSEFLPLLHRRERRPATSPPRLGCRRQAGGWKLRNYIRKTANLDPERGDALTWRREDFAPLYAPTFPKESRRDILDAALGWFCSPPGTPTPHLDNPLADAFLQTIISRQKKKVEDYIAGCDKKVYHKDGGNMGQHEVPHVANINQSEDKDTRRELSLSSVEGDKTRADAALVPFLSVEEAKQELAIIAPQISSHPCMKTTNGEPTAKCRQLAGSDLSFAVMVIGDKIFEKPIPKEDDFNDYDDFEKAQDKYDEELERKVIKPVLAAVGIQDKNDESRLSNNDKETFKRAYVHAVIEANNNDTKICGKPVKNKIAFVIARMKRAKEAVKVLEAAKAKKPLGDNDY